MDSLSQGHFQKHPQYASPQFSSLSYLLPASVNIGASLVAQMVKRLPTTRETWVRSLGREDPLEKENGNPLQYSSLGNPMDRGAWWVTVHGVAKELDTTEQPNNYLLTCK